MARTKAGNGYKGPGGIATFAAGRSDEETAQQVLQLERPEQRRRLVILGRSSASASASQRLGGAAGAGRATMQLEATLVRKATATRPVQCS